MIRGGFLDPAIRADLITLVRDGKAETRLTRRANALLLLDDGMSCAAIAKVRREFLDHVLIWNAIDLERKLDEFRIYKQRKSGSPFAGGGFIAQQRNAVPRLFRQAESR